MLVIGLTGGIGSGKTTVAKLFAEFNIPIIDADLIARELVEPGQPALEQIVRSFGPRVVKSDGTLDRRRLRERVFADPEERKTLEEILHPLIRQSMMERLERVDGPYVVMVVPLLVDTGNWDMIDRILVVDVDEETQLQRVMQRDGVNRKQAESIVDTQISREDRLEAADDVMDNTGDITALREEVARLHEFYVKEAGRESPARKNPGENGPDRGPHVVYEQPLNERIRTFLRLENLFARAHHHRRENTPYDAHSVINTLIEIVNLTGRGDLKSEIIKELERQHASLKRHSDLPGVDQKLLRRLLDEQNECIQAVHSIKEQLNQHLKNDLLFNSVRQRLSIPGGTSDFDLPVYNYWLNGPGGRRAETLQAWLEPFREVERAIATCLTTIRESATPLQRTAENGYFEQTLDSAGELQLIRVLVPLSVESYPTVSAGRQRLNVRFMQWIPGEARSPQVEEDIEFSLMLCGI